MGNIFSNSCIDCSRRNQHDQRIDQTFEGILEQECIHWDTIQKRFLRTKFFVTRPKNNKIYYISDSGSIMRIEQISDQQLQQFEILTNIEQIKYLKWVGQYGNNQLKNGQWKAFWQGEALIGIGGAYSEDGKKQGQWNQPFQNFSKQFQVCENGKYLNDQKIQLWKYTLRHEDIGGGLYDNQLKQGQWIELVNNFSDHSQITLQGEYKNGNKVGRWDVYHRKKIYQHFEIIGGGSYDDQEGRDSFKIGKWQEPSDGFHNDNQVMYEGEYQNGIKVGKWKIYMICKDGQSITIGEEQYGNQQEAENLLGIKQGKQCELMDLLQNSSQITYFGEYRKGIKVGRWEIYWNQNNDKSFKLIGGGLYQDKLEGQFQNELKQGRWVELSEEFRDSSQITWKGDYQNNNKVGRWNIRFYWKNIGGGLYDVVDVGLTTKVGKWIEISDRFDRENQIIYKGTYKYGKKVGRWHIQIRNIQSKKGNEEIGGGCYDEEGQALKIGKWIDVDDGFSQQKSITYHGEYKNGKKVRRWDTYQTSGEQLGGGCYDEKGDGIKIGKWIDLDDAFDCENKVTYHGEYYNGKKVGKWNTYWTREQRGGGSYDEQGDGIKNGKWIDLSDKYQMITKVIFAGEYKNGKKVGMWMTLLWNDMVKYYQQIGGGCYDGQGHGTKNGKWIELDENNNKQKSILYYGEYKQGKKIGRWDIMKKRRGQPSKYIGGGSYDEKGNGVKIGEWIDLDEYGKESRQITLHGKYQNGEKVGIWKVFLKHQQIAKIQYLI